jgi:hypothetical protein
LVHIYFFILHNIQEISPPLINYSLWRQERAAQMAIILKTFDREKETGYKINILYKTEF